MTEPVTPPRGGPWHPGVTPKRNVRVGADWDELDRLTGTEKMTDVIKRLVAAEVRRLRRRQTADG